MEREERFIEEKFGRRTPFKVPEGYFDDFASQLMQSLPESEDRPAAKVVALRKSAWHRLRPVAIGVASVCAAVFGIGVFMHNGNNNADYSAVVAGHAAAVSSSYSAVDAMADYTMLDNEDMYNYLADI